MFRVGSVYTHGNLMDVMMLVLKADSGVQGSFLTVRWFKKNGLDLNAKDDIYVNKEDYGRWVLC